jgi:hypothetical protein
MTSPNPASSMLTPTSSPAVTAFLDAYAAGPGTISEPVSDQIDLADRIRRMRIGDTPFPYGVIDGFLPSTLYEAIVRDWPAPSSFAPVTLPEASNATWNQVAASLRAPSFVRSLFACFSDVVDANLTALGDNAYTNPGFRLYQCVDQGAEEALGAHVDALHKLLTIVIYIDLTGGMNEDSERLWGTSLYDTEPGSVAPVRFTSNANHDRAGHIGFVPNRALVMPNCSRALHGVTGGQAKVQRRTLMCGYWAFN